MCKSADQSGGPYRCSGDMGRAYDRATVAYQAALEDTAGPFERQTKAQHRLERTRAMKDAIETRTYDDPSQKQHQLDVIAAAEEDQIRELTIATKQAEACQTRLRTAGSKFAAARADYDATPRGVADLQHRLDAVAADDPDRGEFIRRRDAALDRMNEEGAERHKRWGTTVGTRTVIRREPRNSRETWKRPYAEYAGDDQLAACSTNYGYSLDADTGAEYDDYEVIFYRQDDSHDSSYMRVQYRNHISSPPPSQADVLATMSRQSALYEATGGFQSYCRRHGVAEEDLDILRRDFDDGKRYSKQLRKFLGDGAEKYLRQANNADSHHADDDPSIVSQVGP